MFVNNISLFSHKWSSKLYLFGRNEDKDSVCVHVPDFQPSFLLGGVVAAGGGTDGLLDDLNSLYGDLMNRKARPFERLETEKLVYLIGFTNNAQQDFLRVYLRNPSLVSSVREFFGKARPLTLGGREFPEARTYHLDWDVDQQFMHKVGLRLGDYVRLLKPSVPGEKVSTCKYEYEVSGVQVTPKEPTGAWYRCAAVAVDFGEGGKLTRASGRAWWSQPSSQQVTEFDSRGSEASILKALGKFWADADYLVFARGSLSRIAARAARANGGLGYDVGLSRFRQGTKLWKPPAAPRDQPGFLLMPGRNRLQVESTLQKMNASPPLDTYTLEAAMRHPGICRATRTERLAVLKGAAADERVRWMLELEQDNNFVLSNATIARASNTPFTKVAEGGQQRKVWNTLLAHFHKAGLVINKTHDCDAVIVERSNAESSFPDPVLPPNVPLRDRGKPKVHKKRSRDLRGDVVPTKAELREAKRKRQRLKNAKKFKGGYVTEPASGFYERPAEGTVTVDFKSMYPSIIIGYRMCYMSVVTDPKWLEDPKARVRYLTHDQNFAFAVITHYDGQPVRTIVPEIVAEVMELRKQAKRDMKRARARGEKFESMCLDFRQLSYKVFQNSVYGFFGVRKNALLGYKLLMAGICVIGQYMIKLVTQKALEADAFVVYGDTDSIMVQFPGVSDALGAAKRELFAKGTALAAECNRLFPAPNELEVETLKLPFACLKRKMYFAHEVEAGAGGWKPEGKTSTKGLGFKKRDRCVWVREIGYDVVKLLLAGYPDQVEARVRRGVRDFVENRVPYDALARTCLMKEEDEYVGNLIQVHTAKAHQKRTGSFPAGERLGYVVLAKKGSPLYLRGETTEYARERKLPLDSKYYLQVQLLKSIQGLLVYHPQLLKTVTRLVERAAGEAEQRRNGYQSLFTFFAKG
jgi:DNA polymerase elongation subunit (family B)